MRELSVREKQSVLEIIELINQFETEPKDSKSIQKNLDLLVQLARRCREISWSSKFKLRKLIAQNDFHRIEFLLKLAIRYPAKLSSTQELSILTNAIKKLLPALNYIVGKAVKPPVIPGSSAEEAREVMDSKPLLSEYNIYILDCFSRDINQVMSSLSGEKKAESTGFSIMQKRALLALLDVLGEYAKRFKFEIYSNQTENRCVSILKYLLEIRNKSSHRMSTTRYFESLDDAAIRNISEIVGRFLQDLTHLNDAGFMQHLTESDVEVVADIKRRFTAKSTDPLSEETMEVFSATFSDKQRACWRLLSSKAATGEQYCQLVGINISEAQQLSALPIVPPEAIAQAAIKEIQSREVELKAAKIKAASLINFIEQSNYNAVTQIKQRCSIELPAVSAWLVAASPGGVDDEKDSVFELNSSTKLTKRGYDKLQNRINKLNTLFGASSPNWVSLLEQLNNKPSLLGLSEKQLKLLALLRRIEDIEEQQLESLLSPFGLDALTVDMLKEHIKITHRNGAELKLINRILREIDDLIALVDITHHSYPELLAKFSPGTIEFWAAKRIFKNIQIYIEHFNEDTNFSALLGDADEFLSAKRLNLLRLLRNKIAHNPELIDPNEIVWFFKSWTTAVNARLTGIKQLFDDKQAPSTPSPIVKFEDNYIGLKQIVVQHDLIEAIALALGFSATIRVFETSPNQTILVRQPFNIWVQPYRQGQVVDGTKILELEWQLMLHLKCRVVVYSDERFSSMIQSHELRPEERQAVIQQSRTLHDLYVDEDKRTKINSAECVRIVTKEAKGEKSYVRPRDDISTIPLSAIHFIQQKPSVLKIEEETTILQSLLKQPLYQNIIEQKADTIIRHLAYAWRHIPVADRKPIFDLMQIEFELNQLLDNYYKIHYARLYDCGLAPPFVWRDRVKDSIEKQQDLFSLYNLKQPDDIKAKSVAYKQAYDKYRPSVPSTVSQSFFIIEAAFAIREQWYKWLSILVCDELQKFEIISLIARNQTNAARTTLIEDLQQTFLNPHTQMWQAIFANKVEYLRDGFSEEVFQEAKRQTGLIDRLSILDDAIVSKCLATVQYLKRGKMSVRKAKLLKCEEFRNVSHKLLTRNGPPWVIASDYTNSNTLKDLLSASNITIEKYKNFAQDERSFDAYKCLEPLLSAFIHLEEKFWRLQKDLWKYTDIYYDHLHLNKKEAATLTKIYYLDPLQLECDSVITLQRQLMLQINSSDYVAIFIMQHPQSAADQLMMVMQDMIILLGISLNKKGSEILPLFDFMREKYQDVLFFNRYVKRDEEIPPAVITSDCLTLLRSCKIPGSEGAKDIDAKQSSQPTAYSSPQVQLAHYLALWGKNHATDKAFYDYLAGDEDEAAMIQLAIQNSLKDDPEVREKVTKRKQELAQQAARYGYDCEDMLGDGNCFFYAVADQLKRLGRVGQDIDPDLLRMLAAVEIDTHRGRYLEFIPVEDRENFARNAAKPYTYVGLVVANAIARIKNVIVAIIPSDGGRPQIIRPAGAAEVIVLGNEVDVHFQSLVAKDPILKAHSPKIASDALQIIIDSTPPLPNEEGLPVLGEQTQPTLLPLGGAEKGTPRAIAILADSKNEKADAGLAGKPKGRTLGLGEAPSGHVPNPSSGLSPTTSSTQSPGHSISSLFHKRGIAVISTSHYQAITGLDVVVSSNFGIVRDEQETSCEASYSKK